MSIVTLTVPAVSIYFIGATANNKLSVAIIGTTKAISAKVLSTPPNPTANPPKHPVISSVALIKAKR